MPVNAREAAYEALAAYRKRGARPDMVLAGTRGLEGRDMALAVNMTSGTLQNAILLDYCITRWSGRDAGSMTPEVRDILRLSAYQILFLDRVPAHAAVSQGVELAKHYAPRAAGLVNAVLRKAANAGGIPDIDAADPAERLSIRWSHPLWLTRELMDQYGPEKCEAVLRAGNTQPPVTAQVNTLRTRPEELADRLRREGVEARPAEGLPEALELTGAGRIDALDSFRDGLFYIQDASARLAVKAAALEPGMRVLDLCAAPGGKSLAAALDMSDWGEIRAFDIHAKKLPLIERSAQRLGIHIIKTAAGDGRVRVPELEGWADAVIVDAPCSGIGVIRKRPEIRYKSREDIRALPGIQLDILRNAAGYVAPGGVLVYSTCTVLRQENGDVADMFLAEYPGFRAEYIKTILPGDRDGFFICRMRREK